MLLGDKMSLWFNQALGSVCCNVNPLGKMCYNSGTAIIAYLTTFCLDFMTDIVILVKSPRLGKVIGPGIQPALVILPKCSWCQIAFQIFMPIPIYPY